MKLHIKLILLIPLFAASAHAYASVANEDYVQIATVLSPSKTTNSLVKGSHYHAFYALKRCGAFDLYKQFKILSAEQLFCPGLLQFTEENRFRTRVYRLLSRALDFDVEFVGDLDVHHLRNQLNQVRIGTSRWIQYKSHLHDPQGNERKLAINLSAYRLIVINRIPWQKIQNSAVADVVLLHEFIEALGYSDVNYEFSLTLWWLTQHPERIKPLMSKLERFPPPRRVSNLQVGGVTIVGHGGDEQEPAVKIALLEEMDLRSRTSKVFSDDPHAQEDLEYTVLISHAIKFVPRGRFAPDVCSSQLKICGTFELQRASHRSVTLISDDWETASANDHEALIRSLYHQILEARAEARDSLIEEASVR